MTGNNSYAIVQCAVVDNFGAAECRDHEFVILGDDRYRSALIWRPDLASLSVVLKTDVLMDGLLDHVHSRLTICSGSLAPPMAPLAYPRWACHAVERNRRRAGRLLRYVSAIICRMDCQTSGET